MGIAQEPRGPPTWLETPIPKLKKKDPSLSTREEETKLNSDKNTFYNWILTEELDMKLVCSLAELSEKNKTD